MPVLQVCAVPFEPSLNGVFISRSAWIGDHVPMKTIALPLLLVLALLPPLPARGDSDQDRARAALQAGEVLPLRTILERIERDDPGHVLEVELERKGGRWVYEIKLLRSGGRLLKLEVDAASGAVLKRHERGHRH